MAVNLLITFPITEADLRRLQDLSSDLVLAVADDLEQALRLAAEAEIILPGHWSDELWKAAPRLKWVQSIGAGVESFLTPDFVASPVLLTNAAGVYAAPIADHVMALILHFSRGLNRCVRNQIGRHWTHDTEPQELEAKTLGIVGLGGIGAEVARRAHAFGMRVIAVRRRPQRPSEFADEVRGPDHLPWLLSESDYVALCSALTPQTRHLIGEEELAQMRSSAYIMNIGRGGLIDESALVAAIKAGRIAGAGLDVFETEPLPAESPLWDVASVLITPHTAGSSPRSWDRFMGLFCDNLRRHLSGESFLNVVDKAEGY